MNKVDTSELAEVKSAISSRVVLMTPDVAHHILSECNVKNRKPKMSLLRRISSAIERGEWELNGESVIISKSGKLVDGQHRLEAIHFTKKACPLVLVEGVDDNTGDTIDTGLSRNTGDVLHMNGEVNVNNLSAAVRNVVSYDQGNMLSSRDWLSARQVEAFIAKNPAIRESVGKAIGNRTSLLTPSIVGALHYLFSHSDEVLADMFVEGMRSGEFTRKAFNQFRERLIQNQSKMARLPKVVICAMAIKCFNAAKNKTTVGVLRWLPSETFPVIE